MLSSNTRTGTLKIYSCDVASEPVNIISGQKNEVTVILFTTNREIKRVICIHPEIRPARNDIAITVKIEPFLFRNNG